MNFKNLILLILLVTSCVKVGKNEESNYSRSSFNRLSIKFNDIKSDLIKKSFALLEIRKWKRGKYQQRVNTNKVGPFYILKFFSQLLLKWGSFSALRLNYKINKLTDSHEVFKFLKKIFLNFNDLYVDLVSSYNAGIESKLNKLHVGRENANQNSSIDLLR